MFSRRVAATSSVCQDPPLSGCVYVLLTLINNPGAGRALLNTRMELSGRAALACAGEIYRSLTADGSLRSARLGKTGVHFISEELGYFGRTIVNMKACVRSEQGDVRLGRHTPCTNNK